MEALVAALIGVFGALLGVIAAEVARKRRDEKAARARLRGAARMVSAELGMAADIGNSSVSANTTWLLRNLPIAAWQAHGADLAQVLPDDDFAAVVEAATKVEAARSLGSSVTAGPGAVAGDEDSDYTLGPLIAMCRHAQDVLAPVAYPRASA
jgi:hypothetical protein